jgi:hypothetical protein
MANKLFILVMVAVAFLLPRTASCAEEAAGFYPGPHEAAVLEWINEARANPWVEAQRLGFDLVALREQVGEAVALQWDAGLPPLEWNPELAVAAKAHTDDMLARIYYSHQSPEGMGPEERMLAAGFEPMFWGESLGAVVFVNVIPAEVAVNVIYEGLVYDALNQGREGAPLLDPTLTQAGFYLGGGRLVFGESQYNVYVLACDLAIPIESTEGSMVLWGHVYQDLNGNGRYDTGEGLEGIPVTVEGPLGVYGPMDPVQRISTLRDGAYRLSAPYGSYFLSVEDSSGSGVIEGVAVDVGQVEHFRIDLSLPEW